MTSKLINDSPSTFRHLAGVALPFSSTSGFHGGVLALSIGHVELYLAIGQKHRDVRGVLVHHRLLTRPVADPKSAANTSTVLMPASSGDGFALRV
jgi:hypothetical protein